MIRQVKGYVARKSWFAATDAEDLAAQLGFISKFQSLNSEDAVTWSWFGTLALAAGTHRRDVAQWLYSRVGIEGSPSEDVSVDQWMRLVHPNALESPNGPELDARIQDPSTGLVYVEAKWNATLGTGKEQRRRREGRSGRARRDSMRADPALIDDKRQFAVLGVSNAVRDVTAYAEHGQHGRKRVTIAWLTWDDLASCNHHPRAKEFQRYLDWKRDVFKASAS